MKKYLILLGHVSLLVTAILAIVFYKERVMYVDSGQQVFEMINEGKFKIFLSRYSMVINQLFPWMAIQLGLPLKSILLTYSLSFVFVYYFCFLICVYGLKNVPAGLAIAFSPLFIRIAFGHSISEAWLGVAYSAVFYALLNRYDVWRKKGLASTILFYLSLSLVIAINYFIHPLTLFTLGFSIGYTFFNKKEFKRGYIYFTSLLLLLVYIPKFFLPAHPYEESFFEGIKKADELIPILSTLPIFEVFSTQFLKIYLIGVLIILVTAIISQSTKKIGLFVFTLLFAAFYFVVVSLAFYKGDAPFALESRLIPLIFILLIPFIEMIKERKFNLIGVFALIGGLVFSYVELILEMQKIQTPRIRCYSYFLQESAKYPERKFYVRLPTNRSNPINSWGSATETLLLSSLEGKDHSRTIIFIDEKMDIEAGIHWYPCTFLWLPWRLYVNEDDLNKKYFNLNCTTYRELPYPENL